MANRFHRKVRLKSDFDFKSDVIFFQHKVKIGLEYTGNLTDSKSDAFKSIAVFVASELLQVLKRLNPKRRSIQVQVTAFKSGSEEERSMIVDYKMIFTNTKDKSLDVDSVNVGFKEGDFKELPLDIDYVSDVVG